MTDIITVKERPVYWDALKNITLSAWLYSALVSLIYAIYLGGLSPSALILSIIFTLFLGGTITLIFSVLIAVPLFLFRTLTGSIYQALTIAICGIIAGLVAACFVYIIPMDYSGSTIGTTQSGAIILIIGVLLGTLSGWTGLRFTLKRHST